MEVLDGNEWRSLRGKNTLGYGGKASGAYSDEDLRKK
jgi:hypothetical protein